MTETTIHTGSFLQEFDPEPIESADNVNNEQEENKEVFFDKMSRYYGYTKEFLEDTLTMDIGAGTMPTPMGVVPYMAYSNLKTGFKNAQDKRDEHIKELTGNKFDRDVNTLDGFTKGDFGMNVAFGFADNKKEYEAAIRNHLTEHPD